MGHGYNFSFNRAAAERIVYLAGGVQANKYNTASRIHAAGLDYCRFDRAVIAVTL
jgi:hypothetical protein